jgi:hypothetical protein
MRTLLYVAAFLGISIFLPPPASAAREDWPSFRGRGARGVSEGHPLPASWNVSPPENIRWKTPIPGLSHASPIVWGNSVFVVTAVSSRADETLRVGLYGDIEPVEDDAAPTNGASTASIKIRVTYAGTGRLTKVFRASGGTRNPRMRTPLPRRTADTSSRSSVPRDSTRTISRAISCGRRTSGF